MAEAEQQGKQDDRGCCSLQPHADSGDVLCWSEVSTHETVQSRVTVYMSIQLGWRLPRLSESVASFLRV